MSVLGSLMGHVDEDEIVGELAEVIGRAARRPMVPVSKPGWRNAELAPGVNKPDEGMHPLPLTPQAAGGIFGNSTNGNPLQITYQGQLQVPFRAERLLAAPSKIGTTAQPARLLGQFFVGVHLQQAEIFGIDIELLGAVTGFGTRMTLHQAPPGVLIRVIVTETLTPTAPDEVVMASMIFMGRVVH
jgi:hypothetical protein